VVQKLSGACPREWCKDLLAYQHGPDALVTDLLVTNYEERLLPSWHGLRSKLKVIVAERDRTVAERDGALAEKKNEKLPVDLGSWHATGRWFASLTAARIRERLYWR
jgi:hypothetical protein